MLLLYLVDDAMSFSGVLLSAAYLRWNRRRVVHVYRDFVFQPFMIHSFTMHSLILLNYHGMVRVVFRVGVAAPWEPRCTLLRSRLGLHAQD